MKRKFMYPAFVPLVILAALYLVLYRDDPLAVFRRKSGSWNRVFKVLGLQFYVKRRFNIALVMLVAGIIIVVLGFSAPNLTNFIIQELIGSVAIFSYIVIKVPLPYPKMTTTLPYPRMGRAEFSGPEKGDPKFPARGQSPLSPSARVAINPSVLKMFYISNRNAHFFSLPEIDTKSKPPLTGTVAMFLEQSKPRFAWVQFVYERANLHQLLEYVKFGLLNRQQRGAWQPEPLVRKANQALSKELFAVSARGVLIGADPFNINLSISDEIDSLAVFESRDPNLLYSLAQRKMPKLKVPNYFGSRHETAFFLTTDLFQFVAPPQTNISAPAGLETITVGESVAENYFEASPVPRIEEPFHFPSSGVIELIYDSGGLHVLFGGEYGKAIKALGVSALRYEPLTQLVEVFGSPRVAP